MCCCIIKSKVLNYYRWLICIIFLIHESEDFSSSGRGIVLPTDMAPAGEGDCHEQACFAAGAILSPHGPAGLLSYGQLGARTESANCKKLV